MIRYLKMEMPEDEKDKAEAAKLRAEIFQNYFDSLK